MGADLWCFLLFQSIVVLLLPHNYEYYDDDYTSILLDMPAPCQGRLQQTPHPECAFGKNQGEK